MEDRLEMLDEKIGLLIENMKILQKETGFLEKPLAARCSAIGPTVRNKICDCEKVKKAKSTIKSKSGLFSYFKGNTLLSVSVTMAEQKDIEKAVIQLIAIYNSLKSKITRSEYLTLASKIIYVSRFKKPIEASIEDTIKAYNLMKKHHPFITGCEDVSAAAMIGTMSSNIEDSLEDSEFFYTFLNKEEGFFKGDKLQSLSNALTLIDENVDKNYKLDKFLTLVEVLESKNVQYERYSLPLVGIASIVAKNFNDFGSLIEITSEKLKKLKGFGFLSMPKEIRDMFALVLVTSTYVDEFQHNYKEKIINTTNNIVTTILITMQTAAAGGAASAANASEG